MLYRWVGREFTRSRHHVVEFCADESNARAFASAVLDALIQARLANRRRVTDGATRRSGYQYADLRLDLHTQPCTIPIGRVPLVSVWDGEAPAEAQYETERWRIEALRQADHVRQLEALIRSVSCRVTDRS